MAAAAGALVTSFDRAGVHGLDYSPASLRLLDRAIDQQWPPGKKPADETIGMMGAYVGEVLVRNLGVAWTSQTPTKEPGVQVGGGIAFPLSKVAKRIDIGATHSVFHFYSELAAYLAQGEQRTANWTLAKPPADQANPAPSPERSGFFARFRRKRD
jgi:hypothetical protein